MKSILLIGGSSSVGKTHLSRTLGELLGWDQICVDDPKKQIDDPELRLVGEDERMWDLPAFELRTLVFRQDLAMETHLHKLIRSWITAGKSMVLEGEGIVPSLVSQFMNTNQVDGIFVIETDVSRLYQTFYERGNTFLRLSEPRRQRVAEMNSLYGQWLLSEAKHYRLPWVPSQPWASLAERVLDRINGYSTTRIV